MSYCRACASRAINSVREVNRDGGEMDMRPHYSPGARHRINAALTLDSKARATLFVAPQLQEHS
jgi:hypothetical protein